MTERQGPLVPKSDPRPDHATRAFEHMLADLAAMRAHASLAVLQHTVFIVLAALLCGAVLIALLKLVGQL